MAYRQGQGLDPQGQGLKICPRGQLKAKNNNSAFAFSLTGLLFKSYSVLWLLTRLSDLQNDRVTSELYLVS